MKRNRKPLTPIQKFAKGKPCSLRIPGVCRTTPENEDVVLCHAPFPGRGGMRKDDWWGAPGCMRCHDFVDGRTLSAYGMTDTSREHWYPAIHEWQALLIEHGYVVIP